MIGTITFMQLIERGIAFLDDLAIIESSLPELAAKKILTGYKSQPNGTKEWMFEDRKSDITPRMLMNHTYGGGHFYFNTLLYEYRAAMGGLEAAMEANDMYADLLALPLLWQPGTHTNYGPAFDWLAILIERLTKRSLVDVLEEGILKPLGLAKTGYEGQYGGEVASQEDYWPRTFKTEAGHQQVDPSVLSLWSR